MCNFYSRSEFLYLYQSLQPMHFLLTAWRNLRKNKFSTFLNVFGLTIGMTSFLLIIQYVRFERSYENFIPDRENIYRVRLDSYFNKELTVASAENYPGAGPAMKSELAEVLSYARLYNMGYKNNLIVTYEDALPAPIAFKHRHFLYADSSFLPMMGYEMVSGDAKTALEQPNTAVISEKYARMYFGASDPIGKNLRMQDDDFNNELVKVTGVFKDLPVNTHLKFEILFSYKTLFGRRPERGGNWAVKRYDQSWERKDMYTFIKVRPGTDSRQLESKFPAIVDKHSPDLKSANRRDILTLQPLADIHLKSDLAEEPESNGDARIVSFLFAIGIFILCIAWINYVNLATARALERAREVGVRKVMGAARASLIWQFLGEAGMINVLALLLSVGLMALLLPVFNSLSGLALTVPYLFNQWFLLLVFGLALTGTMLSGLYPAFVLSSFKPVAILKGKFRSGLQGIFLRKALVVFQFVASIALIAGTLILYRQLNFMMNRDLGVNIDQVLVIERPGVAPVDRKAFTSAIDLFRNELKNYPGIEGVSTSASIPGHQREFKTGVKPYGTPDDKKVVMRFNTMDYDYLDVYKMKLLAGRMFSRQFTKDPDTSAVITASAAKLLGFSSPEDAVGHTLTVPDFEAALIVVGVVNDYHQVSMKKAIEPTIFSCTEYYGEYYSIRINNGDPQKAVDQVQNAWLKAFPGNPFEFFFLDDFFNKQYANEQKFGRLFTVFSILAVIVACLGLSGLSSYTAIQRTKEIGIRKTLGSSNLGIFMLLAKDYMKLIGVSAIVAIPLIYLLMSQWIQRFEYRVPIAPLVFVIAGGAVFLIAMITITIHTSRAAATNPVDSLRHE
jgi:putative ABC transport system permease protein